MIRAFRYRLNPTQAQQRTLDAWLSVTRELYNAALQERRDAWRKAGASVTCYDQHKQLTFIRAERSDVGAVPRVVLTGALDRLDRAFKAFFRRVKAGELPGYPRFKARARWSTLDIASVERAPICSGGRRLKVPLLGKVKIGMHQRMSGAPKAMRLTRDDAGRWWVALQCVDVPAKALPSPGVSVGIDLGIGSLVATSDGELFSNARSLESTSADLKRAQRVVSRRRRGSARRNKARGLLARQHARVANARREHAIGVARSLVQRYDSIAVEALNIKGLARSRLARSVHDASWGILLHWLRVKAESAGREIVEVDPRGTSQTCPACDAVKPKPLSQRVHRCDCGCVLDRDVAAAQVIKRRGARLRGEAPARGDLKDPRSSSRVRARRSEQRAMSPAAMASRYSPSADVFKTNPRSA